jgi:hypothetical protein
MHVRDKNNLNGTDIVVDGRMITVGSLERITLTQDRIQCPTLLSKIINLWAPY